MTLTEAHRADHEPNPRILRKRAAEAAALASLEPGLHWTERLSWRLVADAYRERAERLEAEHTALEAERAALLARLGARP